MKLSVRCILQLVPLFLFYRSPPPYDSNMYRRSLTPQRLPLTMEPIPKEQTIFVGPGGTLIDLNELKKITVDIRRNLPRGGVSAAHGPIRYVVNPSEVVLARRYSSI